MNNSLIIWYCFTIYFVRGLCLNAYTCSFTAQELKSFLVPTWMCFTFKCNGQQFVLSIAWCYLETGTFSVYHDETGWLICCYVEQPEKDPLVSLHLHTCRYGGRETGWVRTLCVWCPPLSVVAFWCLCTFVLWQVISIVSLIFTWWLNNRALKWERWNTVRATGGSPLSKWILS